MNYADRLAKAIEEKGTPAVVGLDPRIGSIPEEIRSRHGDDRAGAAAAVFEFNRRVIDVVAPLVPAVKPNLAFHEAFGWEGYKAFLDTVAHAKEMGLLVIADAKRGDIGSTAEAYAESLFGVAGADAVTLSPWLGTDSLKPFFERMHDGKGCYLLVKTSNPSSSDLQDLPLGGGRTVFHQAATLVSAWGQPHIGRKGLSSVGAVVGATFPEQAAALRAAMPTTPFLLPGYGAQGAKGEMLRRAFGAGGAGAVVNSSRGIIFAYQKNETEEGWEEAVRQAALAMRADLAAAVPEGGFRE
jgi:orotidine-5'-phosphate decarboxylase